MEEIQRTSPEALALQLAWTRRLALRLAGGDEARADDLVGDAWLVVLQGDKRVGGGFLRRTLERLARVARRGEARRQRRERAVAIPEQDPTPEPAALAARAQLLQALSEQVLQLDEPYREVVLLRYLEGLTPTEIAKQRQLPVATIKTRLARALERLRQSMDQHQGGRTGWMGVLGLDPNWASSIAAGLLGPAPKTAFLGGTIMTGKLSGAAIAAAVVGLVWMQAHRKEALADELAVPMRGSALDGAGSQANEAEFAMAFPKRFAQRTATEETMAYEKLATQSGARVGDLPISPDDIRSLSGVLVIPREWNWRSERGGTLSFASGRNNNPFGTVDSFEAQPGPDFRLAWRLEDVPLGEARVSFAPLGARWSVVVPLEGRDDVELIVPRPADLLVRIEWESGRILGQEDLEKGTLGWSSPLKGNDSRRVIMAGSPRPDGLYELRVPAGEVKISFGHPDFVLAQGTIEVEAGGPQDVTLIASKACGLIVKLVDRGGNPARLKSLVFTSKPTFELLGREGQDRSTIILGGHHIRSSQISGEWIRFTLRAPGHYRYHHRQARKEAGVPFLDTGTDAPVEESFNVVIYPGEYTELVITVDE